MRKKIKNSFTPDKKVDNTIDSRSLDFYLYNNSNLIIDFSFEGAFVSCKQGDFNNYLQNNNEFIQKFRKMMNDVQKLSQKEPNAIFNSGEYRHCHKTKKEQSAAGIIKKIFQIIGKDDNCFNQEIEGEDIYQIGLQSEIRLFGIIKGNVFRVYFIDYCHDFAFDQAKNARNRKNCKFCAIKSSLE